MNLRSLVSGVTATCCAAAVFSPTTASTAEEEEVVNGQDVLVECPVWNWEASQIPGVSYELCFDDIDQCVQAEIGDVVCIPGMGPHDVWVTAVDDRGAETIYYDGEMAPIDRIRSADFDGSGLVGFPDVLILIDDFANTGDRETDLNGDQIVNLGDFFLILDAFGLCLSETGYLYEAC